MTKNGELSKRRRQQANRRARRGNAGKKPDRSRRDPYPIDAGFSVADTVSSQSSRTSRSDPYATYQSNRAPVQQYVPGNLYPEAVSAVGRVRKYQTHLEDYLSWTERHSGVEKGKTIIDRDDPQPPSVKRTYLTESSYLRGFIESGKGKNAPEPLKKAIRSLSGKLEGIHESTALTYVKRALPYLEKIEDMYLQASQGNRIRAERPSELAESFSHDIASILATELTTKTTAHEPAREQRRILPTNEVFYLKTEDYPYRGNRLVVGTDLSRLKNLLDKYKITHTETKLEGMQLILVPGTPNKTTLTEIAIEALDYRILNKGATVEKTLSRGFALTPDCFSGLFQQRMIIDYVKRVMNP
jgi:hypothetical protein